MTPLHLSTLLIVTSLIGGCVTLDTRDQLRVGMTKYELDNLTTLTTTINDDPFVSPVSEWSPDHEIEILYAEGRKYFYVFTDVTQNTSGRSRGNGILHSFHTSITSARTAVGEILLARSKSVEPKIERRVDPPEAPERTIKKNKKISPLE